MKTIGMIGGMSWHSTADYYRLANEMVHGRLGGLHSASCLVRSVDFADIERLQVSGDWELAGRLLADAGRSLEAAGADFLMVCTGTMHKVSADIEAAVSIPLLDIRDVAALAIERAGIRRVGLLATAYTMSQSFYVDRVQSHGIEVVVPDERDRAEVHRVIFEELCVGEVRDSSRAFYVDVINKLVANGCEGVILGCTEIEELIREEDSPVALFPQRDYT